MARGKTKLRKLEREAARTTSLEPKKPDVWSLARDLTIHHDDMDDWDDEFCDHENIDRQKMEEVNKLLSDTFVASFKLAVPSLFRGMVQNLQDQVLRDKIVTFIDHGFSPPLIEALAGDASTKEGIRTQIMLACEDELGDVVLRLSTEDSFDLLCDLAARHGRDLKLWGPPCACSFSKCTPCLARLVKSIKSSPPTPPAGILPIEIEDFLLCINIRRQGKGDLVGNKDWDDDSKWKEKITAAWMKMSAILWQYADEIDPLQVPRVKAAFDVLSSSDGLELFYAIVTREVAAPETRKDIIRKKQSETQLVFSAQFERMKKEIRANKAQGDGAPGRAEYAWNGDEARKALARAIREQGNTAFGKNNYEEAVDQYTRSLGYDATDAVYPLNRAACFVKLKRFADAERDCTAAILLDPKNHKAYWRRAVARVHLRRMEDARKDFDDMLKLQEGNPSVHKELQRMSEQILEAAAKLQKEATLVAQSPLSGTSTPRSSPKPPADAVLSTTAPTSESIAKQPIVKDKGKAKANPAPPQTKTTSAPSPTSSPQSKAETLSPLASVNIERTESSISSTTASNSSSGPSTLRKTAKLTADDAQALQVWFLRAREVLVETLFAHYFTIVIKRETGTDVTHLINIDSFRSVYDKLKVQREKSQAGS